MIGEQIDKYKVLSRIGEGGMATVYLGEHVTLKRQVAVKILHPHLSASQKNRRRFEREARAIEHLQHPNILRIFDFSGHQVEQCYIVTEFVEGFTLRQVLEDQGFLPSEVVAIVGIQLAEALSYAHKSGVVHRDLKPENAMVRQDGVVKLMDFGIARFLDETNITMTGALVGSPAYMSPEQVLERNVGPASDLFSMGSMLYQLVTGRLPFSGSNPSIILRKVIDGTRVPVLECNPTVAPGLAELIEQLLEPDPTARPPNAEDVVRQLSDVLDASSIDRDDPQWSLKRWLDDPTDYDEKLLAHLQEHLKNQGQLALEQGQHREARLAFNRLLALDPEQTEVLAMLSDIPTWHGDAPISKHWMSLLAGLFLFVIAGGSWWWATSPPSRDISPQPTVVVDEGLDPEIPLDSTQEAPDGAPPKIRAPQFDWNANSQEPGTVSTAETTTEAPIKPIQSLSNSTTTKSKGPPQDPMPPPLEQATLEIRLASVQGRGAWADIYIDGRRVGRAPVVQKVSPGIHEIQVTNDYALEYRQTVELEPGEHKLLDGIRLEKRPSQVTFAERLDRACVVLVKGIPVGTLEELEGTYNLETGADIRALELACPNGKTLGPFDLNIPRPGENVTIPP